MTIMATMILIFAGGLEQVLMTLLNSPEIGR
jgi:hypothetical protein